MDDKRDDQVLQHDSERKRRWGIGRLAFVQLHKPLQKEDMSEKDEVASEAKARERAFKAKKRGSVHLM